MNNKTYIERAKDYEILNHILGYIVSDTGSRREDEFAKAIEISSNGEVSEEEFHDWIASFNLRDYIE